MSDSKDKKLHDSQANKGMRTYISSAVKAATHPVRSTILKALKESEKSTVELEGLTGESRYNLYHHLNALENADLVDWKLRDNKTKLYSLKTPQKPQAAVIILNSEDIKKKKEEFKDLINVLARLEEQKIPFVKDIIGAEICLYYNREDDDKG